MRPAADNTATKAAAFTRPPYAGAGYIAGDRIREDESACPRDAEMTAGEQRLAAWDRHEFMTTDMQNEAGRVVEGSYCQRCSMFAPHGMYLRLEPCRPVAEPETRPGPKVVT